MRSRQVKQKRIIILISVIILVVLVFVAALLIKKFSPSNKVMDLKEYYSVEKNEALVILQDEVGEKKALYLDGQIYIDYNTVIENINKRFYWDNTENILIYTTPSEIIKAEVGSQEYMTNKSKSKVDYQIVKTDGDEVYIALDYIELFSNVEAKFYKSPNRIVIKSKWGQEFTYNEVKSATQMRYKPSIKSDILVQLKEGDTLISIDPKENEKRKEVNNGFYKMITEDGVIGYVKADCLNEAYKEKLTNDSKEVEYPRISKDYTINLTWHQVTNQEANNSLLTILEDTKGLNTISPTWFTVADEKGNLNSLASELYMERAHNAGMEVWALCSDIGTGVDMYKLLSVTSQREKLEKELISNAIKYDFDGINIDFENITKDAAVHYIQFLRELSVWCRINGIVLSVDNYVPSEYTAYYDREEQGKIVDYVIVMAYDEHYAGSEESGSVSSINFVKDGISNTLKEVDKEKVIVALPFYTRLWKEVGKGDEIKITSEAYGMDTALQILSSRNITPKWDEKVGQYYGEYKEGGARYRIWLEEDRSFELKMEAVKAGEVAGVASWKLGLEKKSIWNIIRKYIN